jgi:hypothetical protein
MEPYAGSNMVIEYKSASEKREEEPGTRNLELGLKES